MFLQVSVILFRGGLLLEGVPGPGGWGAWWNPLGRLLLWAYTHPTGMHSCKKLCLLFFLKLKTLSTLENNTQFTKYHQKITNDIFLKFIEFSTILRDLP